MFSKISYKLGLNSRLSFILPFTLFSIVFFILPTIFLFVKAFVPATPHFNNWEVAISSRTWSIFGRSIYIGMTSAFIAVIIAIPFGYFVSSFKGRTFKVVAITFAVLPLFVFSISKILSLRGLLLFVLDGGDNGSDLNNQLTMIIGSVYLYCPFAIIPIYSIFDNMPSSLREASNDLGYNSTQTMFKVIIPYATKAIVSSFGLVFVLASTSIIIADKLLPNGRSLKLIGNLINEHAFPGSKFEIASASSLALITIGIISVIYFGIYVIPIIIRKIKGSVNV